MSYLIIYVADNCECCNRVVDKAEKLITNIPEVELSVKSHFDSEIPLTIVPAVYVNKTLFCYGDFDKDKLLKILNG